MEAMNFTQKMSLTLINFNGDNMKCKCGFDKFIYFIEDKIPEELTEIVPKFCPQCGEKLQQEPLLPWWCVPRMYIMDRKNDLYVYKIIRVDKNTAYIKNYIKNNSISVDEVIEIFKPFGGPFDMIPKGATGISFNFDGSGYFIVKNYIDMRSFPIWNNCPEQFKGKAFSLEGLV